MNEYHECSYCGGTGEIVNEYGQLYECPECLGDDHCPKCMSEMDVLTEPDVDICPHCGYEWSW